MLSLVQEAISQGAMVPFAAHIQSWYAGHLTMAVQSSLLCSSWLSGAMVVAMHVICRLAGHVSFADADMQGW